MQLQRCGRSKGIEPPSFTTEQLLIILNATPLDLKPLVNWCHPFERSSDVYKSEEHPEPANLVAVNFLKVA